MHPTKRKVNLPSLSFCKNGTHGFTTTSVIKVIARSAAITNGGLLFIELQI